MPVDAPVPMPSVLQATVALPWAPGRDSAAPPMPEPGDEPPPTARAILRPLPALPEADRAVHDAEERMRLAVALDVLCTATRRIAPGPTILMQMVQAWLSLRGWDHDSDALGALLQQAQGPQGTARAHISRGLTAAADVAGVANGPAAPGGSAPETVADAARRVEAAGSRLVDEAVLWLSSRERVDYRRG